MNVKQGQGDEQEVFDIASHTPACIGKFNRIEAGSAKGCCVESVDGKRYLDLSAGIGVLSTGHCHPYVVERVKEQMGKIIFAQQNCIYTTNTHKEVVQKLLMNKHIRSSLSRKLVRN